MRPHQKEKQKSPKLSEQSWFRQDCSKSWDKILLKICHSHTTPAKKSAITKTCPKRKNNKMAFDLGSSMAGPKTIPPCSFFPYIDFFLTKKRKSFQKKKLCTKIPKNIPPHPTEVNCYLPPFIFHCNWLGWGGVGCFKTKKKKTAWNQGTASDFFFLLLISFFAFLFFFSFSFLLFLLSFWFFYFFKIYSKPKPKPRPFYEFCAGEEKLLCLFLRGTLTH